MKNNNSKQTVLKNKKRRKLFLICGITIAAVAAGAVSPIVIFSNSSNTPIEQKYTITFSVPKDSQAFFSQQQKTKIELKKGSRFCDIITPEVKNVSNFVGWAKTSDFENGKIEINKLTKFNKTELKESMDLTAVFTTNVKNSDALTWVSVNFLDGGTGEIITGNRVIQVPANTLTKFGDLNRPSVQAKKGDVFLYWTEDGTNPISDSQAVVKSMSVKPKCTVGTTVNFDLMGGTKTHGDLTVPVELNSTFGNINKPSVTKTGMYFSGWCSDEACTKLMYPSTQITKTTTAYAKWTTTPSDTECIVKPVKPAGATWEFDSSNSFVVERTAVWNTFNHPHPDDPTLKVKQWKWNSQSETAPEASWSVVDPNSTVFDCPNAYIKPVMETAIQSMIVIDTAFKFDFEFRLNENLALTCYTFPQTISQKVTWKAYETFLGEKGAEISSDRVSFTTTTDGQVNMKVKDVELWSVWVEATSVADPTQSAHETFYQFDPYEANWKYFTFYQDQILELENLSTPNLPINLKKSDGTILKTFARVDFDCDVYLGENVEELEDNFMKGCSAWGTNGSNLYANSFVTKIGDNCFEDCAAANPSELPMIITDVQTIGNNFMAGCKNFDQPLSLNSLTSIGDNFLKYCTNFNSDLSVSSIESIGNCFLNECISFNHDIAFPSSLYKVGDRVMYDCNAFTSYIDVAVDPLTFATSNPQNFSSSDPESDIATTGFKFTGDYGEAMSQAFPTLTEESGKGAYRKTESVAREIDFIEEAEDSEPTKYFYVGDSFTTEGLKLLVHYKDGSTKVVSDSKEWTSTPEESHIFTDDETGDQQIEIQYQGFTLVYYVTVEGETSDFEFNIISQEDHTCSVKAGKEDYEGGEIEIPSSVEIDGELYTVTEIESDGFNNKNIGSVILPDTLEIIKTHAFQDNESLTSLTIPSSVVKIEPYAFYDSHGQNQEITFDNSDDWNVEKDETSSTLSVSTGTVNSQNLTYASDESPAGYADYTWTPTVVPVPQNIFGYEPYTDPETGEVTGYVAKLRDSLTEEQRNEITQVDIPEVHTTSLGSLPVVAIATEGFAWLPNLTSVSIPNYCKFIADSAFAGCTNLTTMFFANASTWKIATVPETTFEYDKTDEKAAEAATLYKSSGSVAWELSSNTKNYEIYATTTNPIEYSKTLGADNYLYANDKAVLDFRPPSFSTTTLYITGGTISFTNLQTSTAPEVTELIVKKGDEVLTVNTDYTYTISSNAITITMISEKAKTPQKDNLLNISYRLNVNHKINSFSFQTSGE